MDADTVVTEAVVRAAVAPLPYVRAAMRYQRSGSQFHFEACRPSTPRFDLAITFLPGDEGTATVTGTLDEWLLERYRLFACDRDGALLQAAVSHPQWITRIVAVAGTAGSLGSPVGLDWSRPPDRAHFSDGLRARFGTFSAIGTAAVRHDESRERA